MFTPCKVSSHLAHFKKKKNSSLAAPLVVLDQHFVVSSVVPFGSACQCSRRRYTIKTFFSRAKEEKIADDTDNNEDHGQ